MGRIIFLGTSGAVPDAEHENTHMLVESRDLTVLVDCPGGVIVRLGQAGVDLKSIDAIILTHFHPDHVSGFAHLLMSMWLVGRKEPVRVYGLERTIHRAQQMMDIYEWQHWPNFFPVQYEPIKPEERTLVIQDPRLEIYASQVEHMIPTIGLRFYFPVENYAVAYSCDTQPSQIVRRLAQDAQILIHEATGATIGHTPAEKAGEIAAQAGVEKLYLIHYYSSLNSPESLIVSAQTAFHGEVELARDLMVIQVGAEQPA